MPGRSFSGSGYRFGFNGKEKDDEIKGAGNSLDFGARIYDTRVEWWFSVDPKFKKGPGLSPYSAFFDNPISHIDENGMWPTSTHTAILTSAFGMDVKDGKMTAWSLSQLVQGSKNADSPWRGPGLFGNQSDALQFIHGMKPKNMSTEEAKKASEKWIEVNVDAYVTTGDPEKLGEALHTIMDMTSPVHRIPPVKYRYKNTNKLAGVILQEASLRS